MHPSWCLVRHQPLLATRLPLEAALLSATGVLLVVHTALDPQRILGGRVPNPVLADDLEDTLVVSPMKAFAVVRVERVVDHAPLSTARAGFVYVDQKLPCRQKVLAHVRSPWEQ